MISIHSLKVAFMSIAQLQVNKFITDYAFFDSFTGLMFNRVTSQYFWTDGKALDFVPNDLRLCFYSSPHLQPRIRLLTAPYFPLATWNQEAPLQESGCPPIAILRRSSSAKSTQFKKLGAPQCGKRARRWRGSVTTSSMSVYALVENLQVLMSQETARSFCFLLQFSAHLLTITSGFENSEIRCKQISETVLPSARMMGDTLLDLSRNIDAWNWKNGEANTYRNWAPGQPDNTQDCAVIQSSGTWATGSCDAPMMSVCQFYLT